MGITDPDELVALGALAGAQVLVVCLSVVIANAYRERALLVHAAATMLGILTLQLKVGGQFSLAGATAMLLLAGAGLHLRELVNPAGAVRRPHRWLGAATLAVLPGLAVADALVAPSLLPLGMALWTAVVALVVLRAWPQGRPWLAWLCVGLLALLGGVGWLASHPAGRTAWHVLPTAALLAVWSATTYLATVWHHRSFSETRIRLEARNTVDPLTGLSTPMVLAERVHAARALMKRYGHPSVLLLVHIENLGRLAGEFGPEAAESAVLVAANRIRQSMSDGDVAARISHSRIAVLAEGASVPEGTANLATRILVAGLKEPLPSVQAEFLHFRIVLAAVPVADIPPKALLQRLSSRMDEQLRSASERRIHAVAADELPA